MEIADNFILDKMWAKLIPMPTVTDSVAASIGAHAAKNVTQVSPQSWLLAISTNLPLALRPPSPLEVLVESIPFSEQSAWPRDYILRQLLSISLLSLIGIHLLYFIFACASYYFVFDHRMMKHPRFLKNQIRLEISTSLKSFPGMLLLTLPWFQGEVMGYSRLYKNPMEYGLAYLLLSIPLCVKKRPTNHTPFRMLQLSIFFFLDSFYSPTFAFTGFIDGYISLSFTSTSTNRTTNGSSPLPSPHTLSTLSMVIHNQSHTTSSSFSFQCSDMFTSSSSSS